MKALLIGAGVVITLAVITIGFIILNQGQNTAKLAVSKVDKLNSNIVESEFTVYDAMEISGNEVVTVISKFKNEPIAIKVVTKKNSGTFYNYTLDSNDSLGSTSSEKISQATEPTSDKYINPSGRFKGEIKRDENFVVTGLVFTQQ